MSYPESRSRTVDGGTLSWRERGQGTALVLVHGIGGSSESWGPVFERFSARHRVFAWDAPGYGASDLLEDVATAGAYADRLAALLSHEKISRAHLVAHSIGSPIAAALSGAGGITVETLTLVHPVAGFGGLAQQQRTELRAARLADIEGMTMQAFGEIRVPQILGRMADASVAAEAARIIAAIPEAGYRAMVELMASADLIAALPGLRVPTLVIAGDDDTIAPPRSCQAIAESLPEGSLETYPGIGHYMMLEAPGQFVDRLEKFLATGIGR